MDSPSDSFPAATVLAGLQAALDEFRPRLLQIPEESAGTRLEAGKWSAKEELGHLIDSALNNHARLMRMQMETRPLLPGYEQDEWVRLNGYQERPWAGIVELWWTLNLHLLRAARRVTAPGWERTGLFDTPWQAREQDASGEVTLGFVLEDYLAHLRHHLEHLMRWRQ